MSTFFFLFACHSVLLSILRLTNIFLPLIITQFNPFCEELLVIQSAGYVFCFHTIFWGMLLFSREKAVIVKVSLSKSLVPIPIFVQ